jgi:formamidopyrimidine-DNA glycosylase
VSAVPELPEVETMRRGIAGVVGSMIQAVERPRCQLKPLAVRPGWPALKRRLAGQRITGTGRLGKRVALQIESGDSLIFEPRMAGLVLVGDPPNEEHLRFRLRLAGPIPAVLYWDRRGLGNVSLYRPDELHTLYGPERLGPDALECSPEIFVERLGKSRRAIKVALLDQKAVAGIGNLYASEILHRAAIHPATECTRLGEFDWQRLAAATSAILTDAIQYEGSTLGDGTYRNALNQDGSYQNHHRVYARDGQACLTCADGQIVRVVQAQRSTFYCPRCQGEG